MTITIKEENKGTHQETSLRIHAQINSLLKQSGITNYQPQSFTSLPNLLNIQSHLRTQMTDEAMSKIEGLVALYGALHQLITQLDSLAYLHFTLKHIILNLLSRN